MTTEQLLDIVLITFNRASQFEKTLEMLFAPDSPVRNCDLTILDNKSTDETPQIAERYAGLHPNVKHHVNNFNVGGNANIPTTGSSATTTSTTGRAGPKWKRPCNAARN